ncbi:MAG TPA: bifunctional aspartate kinase/homoserine dehydrogenase I [Flavisolibacter sp.]
MQVLKFGGTSVANADNIKRVKDIIDSNKKGERQVVVVSALHGITDKLLHCGMSASGGDEHYKVLLAQMKEQHLELVRQLLPVNDQSHSLSFVLQQFNDLEYICNGVYLLRELSPRTRDRISAFGELISSQIISYFLTTQNLPNEWVDARLLIVTDSVFTRASVLPGLTNERIRKYFDEREEALFVVPGFVAADEKGATTTLGRGGSDYTASIIGAGVNASSVTIWTDVPGMMTADPRIVATAKTIGQISYQEAMELSHFGAKVIYPPTIQPLLQRNIPVWIKNTFAPQEEGTSIFENTNDGNIIRGISTMNAIALISLEGSDMVGTPGYSKRFFEVLALNGINVVFITQASSEHSICAGIEEAFAEKAKVVVDDAFRFEINRGSMAPLQVEQRLGILALVGDKMKAHPGICGRMFGALGRNGINIRAIAQGSSERNISTVISSGDIPKALNVLHEEFFEATYKQVNVYIVGTGNVGSKLLQQLKLQQGYLRDQLGLQLRVAGLANSRTMAFNREGLDLGVWKETLDAGTPMNLEAFVGRMLEENLRNAVFVDITANEAVTEVYEQLLLKTISIVACNKIGASSPYARYKKLKELAHEFHASFLFETNVGAGLPVIGTLNDLMRSGDAITRMEAVLSGTLNYVFNEYDGKSLFAHVVRRAQEEGYTEPDPRLDLAGTDVMRKIMILAREAGAQMELADITNNSFLPAECMEGSVADFYAAMEKHEAHFRSLYEASVADGAKLKFVATYEGGSASVGLQHITPEHNLYHLYGKDNIVLFYTTRYPDQPLVVKGAGAGAEVTASGVFADIIRTARI